MSRRFPEDALTLDSWVGELSKVKRGEASTRIFAILDRSRGGTGAFKVRATDGLIYWLKVADNPQGSLSVVNEVVVSELGRLLKAPLRPSRLCEVPPAFDGWEYTPGHFLHPGVAHASLDLAGAYDFDSHVARARDDNSRRQAQMIAMWQFLLGADQQWLYETGADSSIWSFDHGFWFGGEWGWDTQSLIRDVGLPWIWPGSLHGLDFQEFARFADKLRALTARQILEATAQVPLNWGIADSQLESLGWFVFSRREAVADSLEVLAGRRGGLGGES